MSRRIACFSQFNSWVMKDFVNDSFCNNVKFFLIFSREFVFIFFYLIISDLFKKITEVFYSRCCL